MKALTRENWQEMDPLCETYINVNFETGEYGPLFPDRWVQSVLKPKLDNSVPSDIKKLFEVGRAIMLYGYFFYPFFGHATEQLHRVAEAALSAKYEEYGGPTHRANGKLMSFAGKIEWLSKNGFFDIKQGHEWTYVREARNDGSHLKNAKIYPPMPATLTLLETAERINKLFSQSIL